MVAQETGSEVFLGEFDSASSAPKEVSLNLARINQLRGKRDYVEMVVGVEAVIAWARNTGLYFNN